MIRFAPCGRAFPILLLLSALLDFYLPQAYGAPENLSAVGSKGMVASAHPLASRVGLEILKKGGNAVDAAVAAAFVVGVVEPQASGIGGGGFMLIYSAKTEEVAAIDYREKAPLKVRKNQVPEYIGYRSAGVPGTVAGLALAWKRYGSLDWKDLIRPSIKLAEEGFPVSPTLRGMMVNHSGKLSRFKASARVFLKNGRPYRTGERIVLKDLAETYRVIAEKGPEVFYRGAIAEALVRGMKAAGGWISEKDLEAYQAVLRPAVRGWYRGYEVLSMGPPSSGGVHIIELLNILEGFRMDQVGHNTTAGIHLMAEGLRRVFVDRAKFLGDPDFVQVPWKGLVSKEYAEKLRKGINPKAVSRTIPAVRPLAYESDQTTHLSTADEQGNLVALTQTINSFFGSGVVVPGTGILLNNQLHDFDPRPNRPNSMEPGKRPLSSMSPTLILKDGRPYLSLGMPGATRIISALAQVIMNVIDYRLDIQAAINAPRIHSQSRQILLESRIPAQVRRNLAAMGYSLILKGPYSHYFGGAQAVMVDPKIGKLYGAADPRRGGAALGY